MKYLIILFGFFIVITGFILLIDPEVIYGLIENNSNYFPMYVMAIVIRLVLGICLIMTASQSRYPLAMKIIGFIALLAAIIFLVMGPENFSEMLTSIIPAIKPYGRFGAPFTIAFGSLLVYGYGSQESEKSGE